MRSPTASPFANVARLIASGKPQPEWLIPALEHYSRLVGYRNPGPGDEGEERALLKAVQALEQWLAFEARVYARIEKEFGFPAPTILDDTATQLLELADYLESQLRPPRKGGPTPDSRLRVCAGICAEAWRRLHGEAQPYSTHLHTACEEYWIACGHSDESGTDWEHFLTGLSHP
jgi:hypothetical protein